MLDRRNTMTGTLHRDDPVTMATLWPPARIASIPRTSTSARSMSLRGMVNPYTIGRRWRPSTASFGRVAILSRRTPSRWRTRNSVLRAPTAIPIMRRPTRAGWTAAYARVEAHHKTSLAKVLHVLERDVFAALRRQRSRLRPALGRANTPTIASRLWIKRTHPSRTAWDRIGARARTHVGGLRFRLWCGSLEEAAIPDTLKWPAMTRPVAAPAEPGRR